MRFFQAITFAVGLGFFVAGAVEGMQPKLALFALLLTFAVRHIGDSIAGWTGRAEQRQERISRDAIDARERESQVDEGSDRR